MLHLDPSAGKGGVTSLPGGDVAVMHVGSHHHAGSASVALKRREIVRESTTDCIFQAMTASQEQFKTLDLLFLRRLLRWKLASKDKI